MARKLTIEIDERSKSGKIFLAFIKQFVVNNKGIKVIDLPNRATLKSMVNIESGKGLTKTKSHTDLMRKLNS